jgi:hypothetical protein
MPEVVQGGTFEAVYESGTSGLVGTVAVRIDDNQGATVFGPTTAGIIELGTTGAYTRTFSAPGAAGTQWSLLWSSDGTFDPKTTSVDEVVVVASLGGGGLLPIDGDPSQGPCQAWTTLEAIAECCGTESDTSVLETPLVAASQLLYAFSGRQFAGTCQDRFRPCSAACGGPWGTWTGGGWGWISSLDYGVYGTWGGRARTMAEGCGCAPLSVVTLPGSPSGIVEVTIDGAVVSADTYELRERRWLVRTPDPADPDTPLFWPGCQDLSLPETEDGTFSVLYEFGVVPPAAGQLAAVELACAIHQTCSGGGEIEECPLPNGVVRIQRQGITIDLDRFTGWGRDTQGVWRTGLPLTDAFLNAYNPTGQRSRATVWSPDMPRRPRRVPGVAD